LVIANAAAISKLPNYEITKFPNPCYPRTMAVKVTLLASGSRGNCAVISSSTTRLLLDAGLSCRETLKRLRAAGEDPESLDGILISHEHSDHVAGLPVLARKLKVPVYMTAATHATWWKQYRA